MVVRVNGFQAPLSPYQVSISIIYMFTSCMFFISISCSKVNVDLSRIVMYVDAFLVSCTITSWVLIEKSDPGKANPNIRTKPRYCPTCRKRIAGLDHHCIWLNTCIGANNITLFIILVTLLVLQNCVQIGYIFALFVTQIEVLLNIPFIFAVMLLHQVICLPIWLFVSLLLGFHIYLKVVVNKTTYEWLLSKHGLTEKDVTEEEFSRISYFEEESQKEEQNMKDFQDFVGSQKTRIHKNQENSYSHSKRSNSFNMNSIVQSLHSFGSHYIIDPPDVPDSPSTYTKKLKNNNSSTWDYNARSANKVVPLGTQSGYSPGYSPVPTQHSIQYQNPNNSIANNSRSNESADSSQCNKTMKQIIPITDAPVANDQSIFSTHYF